MGKVFEKTQIRMCVDLDVFVNEDSSLVNVVDNLLVVVGSKNENIINVVGYAMMSDIELKRDFISMGVKPLCL